MIGKLMGLFGAAFVYACVATTVAQVVGVAKLSSEGAFTREKLQRYAAILYGFDLTKLQIGDPNKTDEDAEERLTRAERLEQRVKAAPSIVLRNDALKKGADDIRGLAQQLSTKRQRYVIVKQGFGELLNTLEQDASTMALQEVRRTLEILQPKQTKTLLMTMLERDEADDADDVLSDLLAIITNMPQDKLKKVFGEFKTPEEQAVLHKILVAIGELDER